MDTSDIITLLVTAAFVILPAILDRRRKKARAEAARRSARTIDFPDIEEDNASVDGDVDLGYPEFVTDVPYGNTPDGEAGESECPFPGGDIPEEGVCAVNHDPDIRGKAAAAPVAAVSGEPETKEKIDPRKLIVYSAIMNPKFDE